MHNMRVDNSARSLGVILADIVQELQEFVNTRIQMVKSELHETMSAVSVALPFATLKHGPIPAVVAASPGAGGALEQTVRLPNQGISFV